MRRKHFDNVKSGQGIDGGLGEDFVSPGPDQQFGYPGSRSKETSYAGRYTENKSGLTRTDNFEGSDGSPYGGSVSRQIWSDVEKNSDTVDANHNAITHGVDRGQS